ncbi:MAG: hypothetical protein ACYCPN_01765 [Thermoplasmata archaeon]
MAQSTAPMPGPVPPPPREGEITLRMRRPSLTFLAVGLGFALIFIGAIIAVAGSGPSATASGAANAVFAGRILSVLGLLCVGGGAGLGILQSPSISEDGPAGARMRYAIHRIVAVALFVTSVFLLVMLV